MGDRKYDWKKAMNRHLAIQQAKRMANPVQRQALLKKFR